MSEDPHGERHWSKHTEYLKSLITAENSAIISDFDGTLSAFDPRPDGARIHHRSQSALDRLNEAGVRIALISGRAAADLYSRFPRDEIIYYGNHGFERWRGGADGPNPDEDSARAAITTLIDALDFSDLPGVITEPKGLTATIHYRLAPNPAEVGHTIEHRLRPLTDSLGLRISPGQMIWDIKPAEPIDKGTALRSVVNECGLRSVIFLGDDVTDLDAMDVLRDMTVNAADLRGVSIGVVHPDSGPPDLADHCTYFADGIDDVADFLTWLADCVRI